ncbi:hypothetical protein TNIN_146711 [Trichonephila inaurata madagascariensis]|uniref:Uncharacterized protein n=1 Tax=Trichonephila inaurata madagascariensis TaxID=2747483 RepID=A0A8X6MIW8_9ARAC|nr:hypothetical protein TNIN_146711 [Trichonephila inaurata madagascariensis]
MPLQCYRSQEFFIALGFAPEHRSVLNVRVAISPRNAQSHPKPRLSVQIAADRILQTSLDAPGTPSTRNQTKTYEKHLARESGCAQAKHHRPRFPL